jgi:FKBP-type peptidyl-prolyl cis-trans isomerase
VCNERSGVAAIVVDEEPASAISSSVGASNMLFESAAGFLKALSVSLAVTGQSTINNNNNSNDNVIRCKPKKKKKKKKKKQKKKKKKKNSNNSTKVTKTTSSISTSTCMQLLGKTPGEM